MNNEFAVVTAEQVDVVLAERNYGTDLPLEELYLQRVPEAFKRVAVYLRRLSALLSLENNENNESLNKDIIFGAYGTDVALLNRHVKEFDQFIEQAIRSSIKVNDGPGSNNHTPTASETWQELEAKIPQVAREPLLDLSDERAGKEAPQLLRELQEEFELGVERFLRWCTLWLHMLIEHDYIGLIDWTGIGVCRYYYFRHEKTADVIDEQTRDKRDEDTGDGMVRGQVVKDETIREQVHRERHTHHVVQAKQCKPLDYTEKVPTRVRNLISAIPSWLKGLTQIADGNMTKEEVVRYQIADKTVVSSNVVSRYEYEPGLILDPFVLTGWNLTDLRNETAVFISEAKKKLVLKKKTRSFLKWAAVVSVIAACVVWAIAAAVKAHNASVLAKYESYVANFPQAETFETPIGEKLTLPNSEAVRYGGLPTGTSARNQKMITLLMGRTNNLRGEVIPLKYHLVIAESFDGARYGDISLIADMGVKATLHVIAATEDGIKYMVTKIGD